VVWLLSYIFPIFPSSPPASNGKIEKNGKHSNEARFRIPWEVSV